MLQLVVCSCFLHFGLVDSVVSVITLFIYVISHCVDFIISSFGYTLRRIDRGRFYATHNCIIFNVTVR